MAQLLIANGIDVNQTDNEGRDAEYYLLNCSSYSISNSLQSVLIELLRQSKDEIVTTFFMYFDLAVNIFNYCFELNYNWIKWQRSEIVSLQTKIISPPYIIYFFRSVNFICCFLTFLPYLGLLWVLSWFSFLLGIFLVFNYIDFLLPRKFPSEKKWAAPFFYSNQLLFLNFGTVHI